MKIKTNDIRPPCPKCNSIENITKAGSRATKSGISYRYICKTCKCKFTVSREPITIPLPAKNFDEAILYAIKLSKQTSYTYKKQIILTPYEIANFVNKRFKLKVSHETISKWVANYTPDKILTGVTKNNKPELEIKVLEKPDPDRAFKPFHLNTLINE